MRSFLMSALIVLATSPILGQVQGNLQFDAAPSTQAEYAARLAQKLAELKHLRAEIKELRRKGGVELTQIQFHVQIWRVDWAKLEHLGANVERLGVANLLDAKTAENIRGDTGPTLGVKRHGASSEHHDFEVAIIREPDSVAKSIDSWRERNFAKLLAAPTLTAVEGQATDFNVGEELPIITFNGGTAAVEYRRFGAEFGAAPTLLDDGAVRLKLRPRIRERSAASSVRLNGQTLPGTKIREIEAVVDLKPGQSLAINYRSSDAAHGHVKPSGKRPENAEPMDVLMLVKVELDAAKNAQSTTTTRR